jgi:tetraacyldisaccharide 4'-kinase
MRAWLERVWFEGAPGAVWLRPLSALFAVIVWVRRQGYRLGWLRSGHPGVPVVVIGNISVGGTGKTPLTVWLAQQLQAHGWRVGIVTRGYGGRVTAPCRITSADDPQVVGDEPVLLARRARCPVVVARDRLAAARLLAPEVDVILADDGLQHYRLRRDFEIAVIDSERRFGNGHLLPAGPLRESPARLREVDQIILQGVAASPQGVCMTLAPTAFVNIATQVRTPLADWVGRTVHAIAGIGHPARFFSTLRSLGLQVIEHPLPDHAAIHNDQELFADGLSVVMTEKDAVKCATFATGSHFVLEVDAMFATADADLLMTRVLACVAKCKGK